MALNRRETHRAAIVRFGDVANAADFRQRTQTDLEERVSGLRTSYDKFMEEHQEVIEAAADNAAIQAQNDYHAQVESRYYVTLEKFNVRLKELLEAQMEEEERLNEERRADAAARGEQEAPQAPRENANNGTAGIQLERIKIETFYGRYSQWIEWHAMYESLVHRSDRLDNTQKFHYLKNALRGDAQKRLSGYTVIGQNYQAAYDYLVASYSNEYRTFMAHMDDLFHLRKQDEESYEGLRELIDTINREKNQLSASGLNIESWDCMFAYIAIRKMPLRAYSEWERSSDLNKRPELKNVIEFLDKQSRACLGASYKPDVGDFSGPKLNAGAKYTGTTPKQRQVQNNFQQNNFQRRNEQNNFQRRNEQNNLPRRNEQNNFQRRTEQIGLSCNYCQNPHPMARCSAFTSLPIDQRRAEVRRRGLCNNCFSPNHQARSQSCKAGPCRRCSGLHNTWLCSVQVNNQSGRPEQNMDRRALPAPPQRASAYRVAAEQDDMYRNWGRRADIEQPVYIPAGDGQNGQVNNNAKAGTGQNFQ